MKIRTVVGGGQIFFCPGCKDPHAVNTRSGGPHWAYNGDPERPTFSPSIKVTTNWREGQEICHSFVRDGQIQFLGDCTHELAGKTVDIPEWPHAPGTYGGVEESQ